MTFKFFWNISAMKTIVSETVVWDNYTHHSTIKINAAVKSLHETDNSIL